jgi:hypothetical protein
MLRLREMSDSLSSFKELDTVVLMRDLPEVGLKAGDLGAIVLVHTPEVFEVEFVTEAGETQAMLALNASDLRAVRDDDLLAVRSTAPARGAG